MSHKSNYRDGDSFTKQAKKEGYRSRAAYKLKEILEKELKLKRSSSVIDLGSFPGGWTQVLKELLGNKAKITAIDCQPMKEIEGCFFLQKSIDDLQEKDFEEIKEFLPFDLVLSDMAPNISGIKSADQAGIIYLNELALQFAVDWLKPKGNFLVKSFIGAEFDDYVREVKKYFETVYTFKPKSSRNRSSEIFVYGKSKI